MLKRLDLMERLVREHAGSQKKAEDAPVVEGQPVKPPVTVTAIAVPALPPPPKPPASSFVVETNPPIYTSIVTDLSPGGARGTVNGGEVALELPGMTGEEKGKRYKAEHDLSTYKNVTSVGGDGIIDILRPLVVATISLCALAKEELAYYRRVLASEWPLPQGFKERVAAAYFIWVYSHAESGEAYF